MQKANRTHKICYQVNKELRALGKELRISADVTTYVARHSFATVLKKSGVNIGIISQALGHQDIQTTQIYLSKFDNEQVDDAMQNLL
jgi:site-specific recombinase XerD